MRPFAQILGVAAIAAQLATSFPLISPSVEPCAEISAIIAKARQTKDSFKIEPLTAYDCLRSLPFDGPRSAQLVTEVTKHTQFQSTLETLKNPPKTYESKGIDILGGLAHIRQKASNNSYASQYDFDTELNELFRSANDGHLSLQLCSYSIFAFQMPASLFSTSTDGRSSPLVYTTDDIIAVNGNATTNISNIVKINGKDTAAFLEEYSSDTIYQDPDARYNGAFASLSRVNPNDRTGAFYNKGVWPGFAKSTLTFANGTTRTIPVQVGFQLKFPPSVWNFTSGKQLFERACLPKPKVTTTSAPSNSITSPIYAATKTAGPDNYPKPVLKDGYNSIAGFYLDGDYSDTAVLFVPTFCTSGDAPDTNGTLPPTQITTFAQVAQNFTKQAKADGKKRIIIDLSSNPGGVTVSGFNLYKLFFPQNELYMANRYRDHPIERLVVKGLDNYDNADRFTARTPRRWAWQAQVAPNGNSPNFTSWSDFYGPDSLPDGSNLTSAVNFSNFTALTRPSAPIQGYGNATTTFSQAPFAGEDILIIGDANCGSTCPIFINLMKQHGSSKIRTVVFGGRPNDKTMQLMGGTRGSESLSFDINAADVEYVLEYAQNQTIAGHPTLTAEEFKYLNETRPIYSDDFPLLFGGGNINLRNNYNENDLDSALHFTYEPADCRLYFTPGNVLNPSTMWTAAAEAVWGGKGCIKTTNAVNNGIHSGAK